MHCKKEEKTDKSARAKGTYFPKFRKYSLTAHDITGTSQKCNVPDSVNAVLGTSVEGP